MDCGTVQFPKLWWFLLLHLSSGGGGGGGGEGGGGRSGGRLEASPYIINGIVSMTLLTKQMHKSQRSESIDTETFNHVLNTDHCSHNAIIIFHLRLGRVVLSLAWQAIRLLAEIDKSGSGRRNPCRAASLCRVAAEKWLSKRKRKKAVDICCFVYEPDYSWIKVGDMYSLSVCLLICSQNGSGDWRVQFIPSFLPDRETI